MRFLVRKRRSAPAIIIVALIDVLIVLVIFLLVTTTFKQQPALHLTLPESTSALKSGASENPPLLVSIDAAGLIRFGLDKLPVTLDQLQDRLMTEAEKARSEKRDPKMVIMADQGTPWSRMINVMDAGAKASIKSISAVTKGTGKS
jgi:biopolymer transport protein ExbD